MGTRGKRHCSNTQHQINFRTGAGGCVNGMKIRRTSRAGGGETTQGGGKALGWRPDRSATWRQTPGSATASPGRRGGRKGSPSTSRRDEGCASNLLGAKRHVNSRLQSLQPPRPAKRWQAAKPIILSPTPRDAATAPATCTQKLWPRRLQSRKTNLDWDSWATLYPRPVRPPQINLFFGTARPRRPRSTDLLYALHLFIPPPPGPCPPLHPLALNVLMN